MEENKNKELDEKMATSDFVKVILAFSSWLERAKEEVKDIAKSNVKIGIVQKQIEEMIISYVKQYGLMAFENLKNNIKDVSIVISDPDKPLDLQNTFGEEIFRKCLSDIVEFYHLECDICEREDFLKCHLYSAKTILNNGVELDPKCKTCPYRNDLMDDF